MKPEDNLESPLVASRKRTMELLDITDYRTLRKLVQEGKLDEVQIGDRSKITMQSILLLAGYGSRLQSHEKQKNSQTLSQKHPSDFNSTILSRYSHGGVMGNNLVAVARACANSLRFTPIRSSRNRLKVDNDGKRKLSMKEREVLIYICSVTAERKTKRRAPFTFFQNRQKTIESLWSVTPDKKGYRTKNEDLSRCLAGLVDSGLLIPQQQSGRGIVTEYRINVELMLSTTEEEATLKAAKASLKSVDMQEQEKIDAERKYEQSKRKIWHLVDKLGEKVYCLESEFNEVQAIEHLTGSIDKAECIYCRQICNRRYHGASMDRRSL